MKRKATLYWQFLSSTISTTMVLLLLGALVLFVFTSKEIRDYVHQDLTVTLVLSDETTPQEAHEIEEQLSQQNYIYHIDFISSDQALQEQIAIMGIDPREVLGKNPFNMSLELKLKADYVCSDSLLWIVEDLSSNEDIIDIIYQEDLVDTLNRNLNIIAAILFVITIILSVICISLINNTVHLGVYSKRFIINNMKLIGASWSFIRRPFMLRSFYIGVVSAFIADAILLSILRWVLQFDSGLNQFVPLHNVVIMAVSVFVFALIITMLCTYISVTRFLRMREFDLYK